MQALIKVIVLTIFLSPQCLSSDILLPRQVLCVDSSCKLVISRGKLIRAFYHNELTLRAGEEVEVVAVSADPSNSLWKIKSNDGFFYVDASFIHGMDTLPTMTLKSVANSESHGTILKSDGDDQSSAHLKKPVKHKEPETKERNSSGHDSTDRDGSHTRESHFMDSEVTSSKRLVVESSNQANVDSQYVEDLSKDELQRDIESQDYIEHKLKDINIEAVDSKSEGLDQRQSSHQTLVGVTARDHKTKLSRRSHEAENEAPVTVDTKLSNHANAVNGINITEPHSSGVNTTGFQPPNFMGSSDNNLSRNVDNTEGESTSDHDSRFPAIKNDQLNDKTGDINFENTRRDQENDIYMKKEAIILEKMNISENTSVPSIVSSPEDNKEIKSDSLQTEKKKKVSVQQFDKSLLTGTDHMTQEGAVVDDVPEKPYVPNNTIETVEIDSFKLATPIVDNQKKGIDSDKSSKGDIQIATSTSDQARIFAGHLDRTNDSLIKDEKITSKWKADDDLFDTNVTVKSHSLDNGSDHTTSDLFDISLADKLGANCSPSHISLMGCIIWAANVSKHQLPPESVHSPISRLTIHGVQYLFSVSNLIINFLPVGIIVWMDDLFRKLFTISLDFMVAWILFVLHLVFVWLIGKASVSILLKHTVGRKYISPNLTRYLELEEYNIQLINQLADEEEANGHLSRWNALLVQNINALQNEYVFATSQCNITVSESDKEVQRLQLELDELKLSYDTLKVESSSKLSAKENSIFELTGELENLQERIDELNDTKKREVDKLEKSNVKLIKELKEEQERLYSQATEYYNRMKAMQIEVDKIMESKQQVEQKLINKETEYQSLLTTFNTLKSFELALNEQSDFNPKSAKVDSVESCDFTMIYDDVSDENDNSNKSGADKQTECELVDQTANSLTDDTDMPTQRDRKLKANLSTFLDVSQLHVQLRLKDDQIKLEASKACEEHDLRLDIEARYQLLEKENSELKALQIQMEEEKKASEIKLGVLSDYFKERELELQRDLGKHAVVSSESSDALSVAKKHIQELEIELKVSREQLSALRREVSLTEKSSRRQVAELDKRSHENWLAARSADHQIKELREENSHLRLKLIESDRNALPPALRNLPATSLSPNIKQSGIFSSMSSVKSTDNFLSKQPINRTLSPPNILDFNLLPFPPRLPPNSNFTNINLPIPPPPPPPLPFPGVPSERFPFPLPFTRTANVINTPLQSSNPSLNGSVR